MLPQHLPRKVQEDVDRDHATTDHVKTEHRMADIERTAILQALRQHDYNRTETARALGISRRTLTYKLRAYRDQGFAIDPE